MEASGLCPVASKSPDTTAVETPLTTTPRTDDEPRQWYVLRDFKKWNAKAPAYKALPERGIRCFTPMHWIVATRGESKVRQYVPVIQNLLFAYDTRRTLDPVVAKDPSLQYQYQRGAGSANPMTVPDRDMERFIAAVSTDPAPVYYSVDELTPDMYGREIIITGGPLDGYRGRLLKAQGSRRRRLIVSIPRFIAAAVEVRPDYIRFV